MNEIHGSSCGHGHFVGAYGSGAEDYERGSGHFRRTYCYMVHYASLNMRKDLSFHAEIETIIYNIRFWFYLAAMGIGWVHMGVGQRAVYMTVATSPVHIATWSTVYPSEHG